MNMQLALTKYRGSKYESDLRKVVSKNISKQQFIEKYIRDFNQNGDKSWYQNKFETYTQAIEGSYIATISLDLSSISSIIIGQGTQSVLETHITLHPIYGVPYIPGSAMKGMTAHYCHQILGEVDSNFKKGGEYHDILFGSQEKSSAIHYHDAWITPETFKNCFSRDIMTPHHQAYNQGANQAPRDDDSPVPIPFITVRGDFRVKITIQDQAYHNWLLIAEKLMTQAVTEFGVGGKTNSGYGQMEVKKY